MKLSLLSIIFCTFFCTSLWAQQTHHFEIDWAKHQPEPLSYYSERIHLNTNEIKSDATIKNIQYTVADTGKYNFIDNDDINFNCSYGSFKNEAWCDISLIPYYYDTETETALLVTSFDVVVETTKKKNSTKKSYSPSMLANGEWYKYDIYESGVYTITGKDLKDNGINIDNLKTTYIKIHAKKGFVLEETVTEKLTENPPQIPIIVEDNNNNTFFDEDDRIIFYVEGPHNWNYDTKKETYLLNYNHYSDTASFLLTINDSEEQILISESEKHNNFDVITENGTKKYFHKTEIENLISSGREWVGETITKADSIFRMPVAMELNDIPINDNGHSHVTITVAIHSDATSQIYPQINGKILDDFIRITRPVSDHTKANKKSGTFAFSNDEKNPTIDVVYTTAGTKGKCWIGCVEANLRTRLKYNGQQFNFYDQYLPKEAKVARYQVEKSDYDITILNITNPLQASIMSNISNDDSFIFDCVTDTIQPQQFIAFDKKSLMTPVFDKKIDNQDILSASPYIDYLVITSEAIRDEGEKFGNLHEKYDGYSYKVVTLEEIYNEFTCGQQDMTAVRDYIRRIYVNSGKQYPKFIQLIGGTSYDYKNIVIKDKNAFPTYQYHDSYDETESFGSDDYFVLLDEGEGKDAEGVNDLPLGRIPFSTHEDIDLVFTKIEHYISTRNSEDGLWRHKYILTADDDSRTYITYQESIDEKISNINPMLNITKIYLDAYLQEKNLTGYHSPEASKTLLNAFNDGALILSYFGHGSKLGWAAESFLSVPLIQKIDNYDNMPFVCASTCEFFQFDSPGLTPAGQQLLGHPKGGTFSIISTSRLSLTSINRDFQDSYTNYVHQDSLSKDPSIGKIFLHGKNSTSPYVRNILLFGDPAVKLNYPDCNIAIDSINDQAYQNITTAIPELSLVTLKGKISDNSSLDKMNGIIEYQVFNKPSNYTTLNQEGAGEINFSMRDEILLSGKSSVNNGNFEVQFRLPDNISTDLQTLKIDFYAYDTLTGKVAGSSISNLKITDDSGEYSDNEGPEISGYINSKLFQDNDMIPNNSTLYLTLSDESGINTTNRIIGTEITLTISDNFTPVVLNSYFQPEINDFKSGTIEYVIPSLPTGNYSLKVRAYDLCNNFSDYEINFIITNNLIPKITTIRNYPNPVKEHTYFCFAHNLSSNKVNVLIEFFKLDGDKIGEIQKNDITCSANTEIEILLDQNDLNSMNLSNGMYMYRLTVTTKTENFAVGIGKILIFR